MNSFKVILSFFFSQVDLIFFWSFLFYFLLYSASNVYFSLVIFDFFLFQQVSLLYIDVLHLVVNKKPRCIHTYIYTLERVNNCEFEWLVIERINWLRAVVVVVYLSRIYPYVFIFYFMYIDLPMLSTSLIALGQIYRTFPSSFI